jgi:hypothetical protein
MLALEQEWASATRLEMLDLALEGAFYLLGFTLALRGEEIPLTELRGIHSHLNQGLTHEKPHVVITLLGRFKNELGESYHMMPVLATTPRGLEPGKWVSRVLEAYAAKGIRSGYMFRNADGTKVKTKLFEPKFHERLAMVQQLKPDQSGASRPNVTIREHYVDVRLALNPLLAFSNFL